MQNVLQSDPSPPGIANFFRILSFSLLPPLDTYWQVVYCVLLNWHVSQSVCLFTEVDKLVLFWQWETLFSLPFCIGPVSSLFCNCLSVCHLKKGDCYTATTQCFLLVFCLFSYLCPQLAFCEVNCFWCCQIGITAHTFISFSLSITSSVLTIYSYFLSGEICWFWKQN